MHDISSDPVRRIFSPCAHRGPVETSPNPEELAAQTFARRRLGAWTSADESALNTRLDQDPAYAAVYRRVEQSWAAVGQHAASAVVTAVADEAHKHGLRVLVHNSDAKDVNGLLDAGVDGFVHPPSIMLDVDGSLLKRAGSRHVPVAITLGGYEQTIRSGQATQAQRSDYETSRHNVMTLLKAGAVPVSVRTSREFPCRRSLGATGPRSTVGMSGVFRSLLGPDAAQEAYQ